MVNVSEDLSCELRKFTASQFRSKVYSVPMSECYPVSPILGLYKPSSLDSDDDNDPVTLPTKHSTIPAPSQVVTHSPAYANPTVPRPVHDVIPVQELPQVPAAIVPAPCIPASSPDSPVPSVAPPEPVVVVPPRRSGRQRRAPFWHNPGWDLD